MTYEEAIAYIDEINSKKGSVYGLERVRELELRMGHPCADLKIVHVTGTNGKGSFCTFLAEILKAAGYMVGRFISPTILDYRERIQNDGCWISKNQVADYMTRIQKVCDEMMQEGFEQPTAFEIETVMAFLYFKEIHSDIVLLEVGMGGRGDSTNIIPAPVLSVITSISLDHTALLGHTLAEIAEEKSGIIKGNPALIYAQEPEVMSVVQKQCEKTGSPLIVVDFSKANVHTQTVDGQIFDFENLKGLNMKMLGAYQIYNACAAVKAAKVLENLLTDEAQLEKLQNRANSNNNLNKENQSVGIHQTSDKNFKITKHLTEDAIRIGLLNARWPGRFELINTKPMVVVDGAHNPAGAKSLARSLEIFFGHRRKILIAGIFADKNYQEMLSVMSEVSDTIIVHRPRNARGLDAKMHAVTAQKYFRNVTICDSLSDAVDKARWQIRQSDDVIVSFGSLSTVKELYDIM